MLYLADREALIETGAPITGDRFVSMKFGPVLSRVLNLIKEPSPAEDSVWHSYVARDHFDAVLVGSAKSDHLSEYDEGVLSDIFDSCGREKWPFVVARTHALPEWTDPDGSSIPIDPEDILLYAGFSDEEVEAVAAQARATYKLSHTHGRGRVNPGDTLIGLDEQRHLWMILILETANGQVAIANLTSHAPEQKRSCDEECVIVRPR